MQYYLTLNGRNYDLPKKTVAIMEKLDKAFKVDDLKCSMTQKYQKLLNFIKDIVGEEQTVTIFGSDKLDEIDLAELEIAVLEIQTAYDRPVQEYRSEAFKETMSTIPYDKLSTITKAAEAITAAK